jgi:hypothetical protein
MSLRLFSLLAVTSLFGAIWSSDQEHQRTELARAARLRAAATARADVPIAPARVSRPQRRGGVGMQAAWDSLVDVALRTRARMEEDGCRLRWEMRRTLDGQTRRLAAAICGRASWKEVARGLTRNAIRPVESAVRSAAQTPSRERR